jgi:prevent-host-death family protein
MKVVSITDVRQDGTRVIREAEQTGEPALVVIHSRPVAYIVGASHYDELLAELRRLRREALERDVAEADEQIRRGETREYPSAAALMADIEAEIAAERQGSAAP